MANVENLLAVRTAIVAESVATFNYEKWALEADCGTCGCIGGMADILRGVGALTALERDEEETAEWLGLSPGIGQSLFYGGSTETGFRYEEITAADAIAAIDNVILHGEPRWLEVIATRPHSVDKPAPVRALPASITSALDAREGPLVTDEPTDAELIAAMEAGL